MACCWFGIQTWIGGQGIYILLGKIFGGGWAGATEIAGYPWTLWLCFLVFWALELAIILRGMETLRRFENWAAPFVLVGALALLGWIAAKAGGFGPLLDQPSALGWGEDFWPVFFPSLMGMIGFWATLSLNIPDFTRFGAGQRAQVWGQTLGLPTTMTAFALLSVLVTSGSQAVYGAPIWDPVALAGKADSIFGLLFALVTVLIATISVNIAANVVSPAYDLAHLAPKLINFRTGALITGVVGVIILPWKLTATPSCTSSPGSEWSADCSAPSPASSSPTTGSSAAPSSTSPTSTAPAAATGTPPAGTGGPSSPSSPAACWQWAARTPSRARGRSRPTV